VQSETIANSLVVPGDGNIVTQTIYQDTAGSLEAIQRNLASCTRRSLRRARPRLAGLPVIARAEVGDIERALLDGRSVIVIGLPGSGKSGLAFTLIDNAQRRGQLHLLLDCRDFQDVRAEPDLRRCFALQTMSLTDACATLRQNAKSSSPFLLVIDQLDSIVGTRAGDELVEMALDCHEHPDICVVVMSRRGEVQEKRLLQRYYNEEFLEVQSAELLNAAPYLDELKIADRSEEVERMACNLLNLSLIAKIKEQEPDFDFRRLTSDVALWEQRLEVFIQREGIQGASTVAELTSLAEVALKANGGTFTVAEPPDAAHHRLLSEGLIRRSSDQSCVCSFEHENLQDFLYARRMAQLGRDVEFVNRELSRFRAQNVLLWMERIAEAHGTSEPSREVLLRKLLDV
jgi:hypothetical protein